MKNSLFAQIAFLALSVFATASEASILWTVTTTGEIGYGVDSAGVFGAANRNLSGLTFTQAITVNVDSPDWTVNTNYFEQRYRSGKGANFAVRTTVDGVTITAASTSSLGGVLLIQNS